MGNGELEPRRLALLGPVDDAGLRISRHHPVRNRMGMELENGKERQLERHQLIGGVETMERLPARRE